MGSSEGIVEGPIECLAKCRVGFMCYSLCRCAYLVRYACFWCGGAVFGAFRRFGRSQIRILGAPSESFQKTVDRKVRLDFAIGAYFRSYGRYGLGYGFALG